jgi:hypothetical protein
MAPRVVLGALSAGSGVIHLAMAPVHASSSGLEGFGFAISGWVQLLLALALVLRPSRPVLVATVSVNVIVLALWVWSRTLGLPFGAHAGTAEAVGTLDGFTVAMEALLVMGAGALLARPSLAHNAGEAGLVAASAVPVAVLIATSFAIASPSASEHNHTDSTATGPVPGSVEAQLAAIESTRCDRNLNPVSYWQEATTTGIDTVGVALTSTAASPVSADGHNHGGAVAASASAPTTSLPDPLEGRGSPRLDKIVSKMTSSSEVDAGILVAELSDATDDEYEAFLYQLRKAGAGSHAHAASGDDTGGHGGHIGPTPWVAMTDRAQCDRLAQELDTARAKALSMPTAADAQAAGYRQVTPYVPGIGAHWMNFGYVDSTFEADKPEMVLYDGNGLEAQVVGLSYYVLQPGEAEPTQGFTGDNDHYHRHIGLCSKDGLVIGDSTTTEAECAAIGGKKNTGNAGWMSHAWVVPGCESPWGVFSGASPVLDWHLTESSGKGEGACAGSKARARYDLTPGGGASTPSTTSPPVTEAAAGN